MASDGHWYPPETHPLAPLAQRRQRRPVGWQRATWGLIGAVLGMLAFVPMVRLFAVVFGGLVGLAVAFLIALAATSK